MLLTDDQMKRLTQKTGFPVSRHDGLYWIGLEDGEYMLMPWREITRLKNMRGKLRDGTVRNPVAMKAECVVQRGNPIGALTMREMDVAEWVLGDRFTAMFALTDGKHVMHLIGRMESGARVTLDLTNGLNERTRETERHEVIASDGDLCDLPVGMQYASEDIYVFDSDEKDPAAFTEVIIGDEFYTREEAQIFRDALRVVGDEKERQYRTKRYEELKKLAETAKCSSGSLQLTEVSHEIG